MNERDDTTIVDATTVVAGDDARGPAQIVSLQVRLYVCGRLRAPYVTGASNVIAFPSAGRLPADGLRPGVA